MQGASNDEAALMQKAYRCGAAKYINCLDTIGGAGDG
jgi:hypothetical protein